ncbi:MAG: hypothetical protein GAK30_02614 [Paracidovorax wautersii]|uniref:AB hydrolase-1 domain-containing protein n=1 Tax=Paracidovorax wautersii TaxID=1177982 RepID=A0A7V8FMQ9_9BURK|nr:MAG: hypothetical protein GAK30_02614 [Paracidovorax wautersii]
MNLLQTPARRLLLAWLALLLSGCASVTVTSLAPRDYLAQRRADVLTTGRLSPAAQEVLRVIGTEPNACAADGARCRQAIAQTAGITQEQRLSALAETWLQAALAAERAPISGPERDDDALIQNWLEAARYAYAYLFFTDRSPGERAFEDRQTQVRDYYNFAVQQASALLFQAYQRSQAKTGAMPQVRGWTLTDARENTQVRDGAPTPSELIPASSLRFTGLRNLYRRDGFGAELVAVEAERSTDAHDPTPYREMPYPVITLLLRFGGNTLDEVLATREVEVLLLDPYRSATVQLAGMDVPVAANFTAGYGLWLARSDFSAQALRSLLGLSNGLEHPTVYLMQPYDPSRRVIVMLHGLASSPEAWVNVANEVLGDEQLRRNYQIWQVYYPTNAPIPLNNRTIRDALAATYAHFDPTGQSPASQHITLIGHSMGGVLARLMVSTSGPETAEQALSDYDLDPTERAAAMQRLAPYLIFDPVRGVDSAIFIAAPHRGTPFANHRLARWFSNLVTLPVAMLGQLDDIARTFTSLRPRQPGTGVLRIPNSIDNLSDRDPFVQLAADLPITPRVRYHSIIGDDTPGLPLAESSDGIVPYASAHLPGAVSERVLPSAHSVQEHPEAILEIRRILKARLTGE